MDIFHRHREAQEHELAAAMLELALQTPEYRPEALIWKGIDALPNDPKLAFIYLSNAAHTLPDRADVHALLGRSMLAQGQPELAARYLSAIWQKLPNDPALRMMLWHARSQSTSPEELRRLILLHLPDITAANELAFVLKILAAQPDAVGTVGVVRFMPEEKEIQGWAVDLRNVHAPVALELEAGGRTMSVTANASHPMLTGAGLPTTHGGIRIKVPNPTPSVTVRFATGVSLLGSPISAMPTFVPPAPMPEVGKNYPVDVLIPVYDGLEETLECINSAIAARKLNRTPHRLVVLDDATPVAALSKALKVLASKGKITLIRNPVNLGFIRNMNRAMALSPRQDVVWLNADTRVHGNWLDRLRDTAYASDDIASVTPFTNNGELMSFPVSRASSPMPSAAEQAKLDTLASQVGSPAVELETGCGFCLYIKRVALDAVGYLDELHLKRGYGEETDWCLRARRFGWRHMGATHVFVAHKGGISFGEEKKLRVAYNNAILRNRFPNAEARYLIFCEFDPLTSARNALQRARMSEGDLSNNNKSGYELIKPEESPSPDTQSVQTPAIFCHKQTRKGSTLSLTIAEASPTLIIEYLLPAEENLLVGDLDTVNLMGPRFQYIYEGNGSHAELPSAVTALICANQKKDEYYEHQINELTAIPRKILITDDLRDEVILQLWIDFAQVLKTACDAIQIILIDKGPAIVPLLATGLVYELNLIPGLDIKACAILAGVETEARLELNLLADEFRTGRETLPNGDVDWHAINYQSKIKLLPSDFIKILKMKYSQKV